MNKNVIWLDKLGMNDVPIVGGKNASLGEMISHLANLGVRVPGGFATTAEAFVRFLQSNELTKRIDDALQSLDVNDVVKLAETGKAVRSWVMEAPLPEDLEADIREAYAQLAVNGDAAVAVRSSATAEDLPEASFAGQQETFLNVRGIDDVLARVKEVFSSLYNDRAISYRVHHDFAHAEVALSAGIQRMVRSDLGSSGVMFTIDTESGFRDAVFITSSYGLGECVVQGSVNPDEFYVYKPALERGNSGILRRHLGTKSIKMIYSDEGAGVQTIDVPEDERRQFAINDEEAQQLAQMAVTIEGHYKRPMDVEWAKDGEDGQLYIVQARPETVESRNEAQVIERYRITDASKRKLLVTGRSIGQRIGSGPVRVVQSVEQIASVQAGDILVTDMTDPDWEPVMKQAAAIVTNRGGRTCHAAIIARELGVPAVVGCVDATEKLAKTKLATVSCAEGDSGYVYDGELAFERRTTQLDKMPDISFKVMMNVGNPERAFAFSRLPNSGVGLARLEFIINNTIGIHPKALLNYEQMPVEIQEEIDRRSAGYASPVDFYVEKLTEGVATLGAAFAPNTVIVRMSDFKSNEYYNMVGGSIFEPDEENPMIGFRGASRYLSEDFLTSFELECRALKKARNELGLTNIWIMIPFVRTLEEAEGVISLLEANGLKRGVNDLKVIMMCEVPSNAIIAEDFLEYFDGFSIGSNDLTQLTLGLDRDSEIVAHLFDERNKAVKKLLKKAIKACRKKGKYIGICGQGPSDHPDFAKWLKKQGIESVSLNPDTVVETWMFLADTKTDD